MFLPYTFRVVPLSMCLSFLKKKHRFEIEGERKRVKGLKRVKGGMKGSKKCKQCQNKRLKEVEGSNKGKEVKEV